MAFTRISECRNLEIFPNPLFYFMDKKTKSQIDSDLFQVIVQASGSVKIRIHYSSENVLKASHI